MTDERLEELEQYFLLDNSCEVGLELIAEVRRLRAERDAERERAAGVCDRLGDEKERESKILERLGDSRAAEAELRTAGSLWRAAGEIRSPEEYIAEEGDGT